MEDEIKFVEKKLNRLQVTKIHKLLCDKETGDVLFFKDYQMAKLHGNLYDGKVLDLGVYYIVRGY